MSDRPQATAIAGIGASLMNSPPVDQRMAAPATASTARRMSPGPRGRKGRAGYQRWPETSGDVSENDQAPVRRNEQQRWVVHVVLGHPPDSLAGKAVALGEAAPLRFARFPDQQARAGESEDEPTVGERLHLEDVVLGGAERR